MTPEHFRKVDEIFSQAAALPSSDRAAFLERTCGSNAELRADVESLLAHDATPRTVLKTDALAAGAQFIANDLQDATLAASVPERIGMYRILRVLGEGGFGVVYLAEQENPRRHIALKVLRAGLVTPSLLKRFEYEVQALARLRHPGIAQIYEAGVFEQYGRSQPYFAMEYIDGRPLTERAFDNSTTTNAPNPAVSGGVRPIVELMIRVCDAVQHAHQRGVIHRDLKPANILIVNDTSSREPLRDSAQRSGGRSSAARERVPSEFRPPAQRTGQPKILDFGVARITDADAALTTMHTQSGQIVGTLAYMSPEQLSGDPQAVDTRSDVYSLGVLLFELLGGRRPFDTSASSIHEVMRAIREDEPPRLRALNPSLDSEIELIVRTALEKDPARRYAAAAELAADLERYLRDEPIAARPPTLIYQARKFARRNKALVAGASLAVVALMLGTVGTGWQAWRATRAQKEAVAALAVAQRERANAEAVNRFLTNDLLTAADPDRAPEDRDLKLSEVLTRVEKRVEAGALRDRPQVDAAIHNTLGYMCGQLGRLDAAEMHQREALRIYRGLYGEDDTRVANILSNLGELLSLRGRLDDAEPLLRQARDTLRRLSGPDHYDTGVATLNLAGLMAARRDIAAAEGLVAEARAIFERLGGESVPNLVLTINTLANLKRDAGDLDGAEPLYRDALALARQRNDESLSVALLLNNLGLTYKLRKDLDRAEPLYRESLAIRRKLLPPGHVSLGESLNNLGAVLRDRKDFAAAEPLFIEALDVAERSFPPGSWQIEVTRRSIGTCQLKLKRYSEAEATLTTAYERLAPLKGPLADHARKTAELLAMLYEDWESAEPGAGHAGQATAWRTTASAKAAP